jgi:uncharacterized protein (UPF0332 family)
MANMRKKSEENLKAGNLLIEEELYNASVHCFYYSCYQLLLYFLNKKDEYRVSEEKLKKPGSHNYVINEVVRYLEKDKGKRFTLRNDLISLKEWRKKADYGMEFIKKEDGE